MYRGITPTFTLTLPNGVDLSEASEVLVTFAGKCGKVIEKGLPDIGIDTNVISVYLTQEETLSFEKGRVLIQVNWTYHEEGKNKRACSTIAAVTMADNLHGAVME